MGFSGAESTAWREEREALQLRISYENTKTQKELPRKAALVHAALLVVLPFVLLCFCGQLPS